MYFSNLKWQSNQGPQWLSVQTELAAAAAGVGPWGMTKDDFGLNWRQHWQQQKTWGP